MTVAAATFRGRYQTPADDAPITRALARAQAEVGRYTVVTHVVWESGSKRLYFPARVGTLTSVNGVDPGADYVVSADKHAVTKADGTPWGVDDVVVYSVGVDAGFIDFAVEDLAAIYLRRSGYQMVTAAQFQATPADPVAILREVAAECM